MSTIKTGGAAFPHPELNCLQPGMTLRDYFAAKVMQAIMQVDGICNPSFKYWQTTMRRKEFLRMLTGLPMQ